MYLNLIFILEALYILGEGDREKGMGEEGGRVPGREQEYGRSFYQ